MTVVVVGTAVVCVVSVEAGNATTAKDAQSGEQSRGKFQILKS